jgi:hypothetical protein
LDLTPDSDAGEATPTQPTPGVEGPLLTPLQPAHAVEATQAKAWRPAESAAQPRPLLRGPRAALLGTILIATVAGSAAYYVYSGRQAPPDATARRPLTSADSPTAGTSHPTSIREASNVAIGSQAATTGAASGFDAIETLGIARRPAASKALATPSAPNADAAATTRPDPELRATQAPSPTAVPASRLAGADAAATPAIVLDTSLRRSSTNAPPITTRPVPCTDAVAAVGLCTPTSEEERK